MKNKFIYISSLALLLSATSCSDFLDEDNKKAEIPGLTYMTSAGIEGLVASCYSYTRAWYGKEAGLGLSEMGTDLFYAGYDNKQRSLVQYSLTPVSLDGNSSDNPSLDHYWEAFYCAVDVCNTAIHYIGKNPVLTDKAKDQHWGEVYFLRAFYYLHMVNTWGAIPYNDTFITEINTNPERMSEEEVYSRILADLDKSINYFESAGYTTKAEGRANYWASRALKARTLLYAASWLGDKSLISNSEYSGKSLYALAQSEAEAVIGSGTAEFYDNFSETFSMKNEDVTKNKEAIWGVTYSSDISTAVNCIPKRYRLNISTGIALDYNSLITRTGYSRGGSAMLLMFVSMWNNGANDLGGNGKEVFVRPLDPAKNFHVTNTVTKEKIYIADHYSPYGRGFTRYLPSMYLWNLMEQYRETDQRTEATLLTAYTIAPGLENSSTKYPLMQDTAIYYCPLNANSPEGIAKQQWAKNRYRIQFAYNGDIPVFTSGDPATALPTEAAQKTSTVYGDDRYNSYKIGGWCSYPGIKKFLDDVFDEKYPTHDISSRDAIVLRLAEMYLIKAECQLNTSNGAQAMATINELRKVRAIEGKDNSLSGAATLETILDERAIELCGEQQRWFDLKRTKTLVERVKKYNAQGSGQMSEKHYLRPIPEVQMQAVTNASKTEGKGFWQNAGY